MVKRLSYSLKQKYYPLLIIRDGYKCFYCKGDFSEVHLAEYDHLNNDVTDNRLENLVFCHRECNNKKKYSSDMQIMAHEKLLQNERAVFVGERKDEDQELSEQEISKINRNITKTFLLEHTSNDEGILLSDTVNAIVDICNKNNGTGSQSAVNRYIDALCNTYTGSFVKEKNPDGKWIIRRRNLV